MLKQHKLKKSIRVKNNILKGGAALNAATGQNQGAELNAVPGQNQGAVLNAVPGQNQGAVLNAVPGQNQAPAGLVSKGNQLNNQTHVSNVSSLTEGSKNMGPTPPINAARNMSKVRGNEAGSLVQTSGPQPELQGITQTKDEGKSNLTNQKIVQIREAMIKFAEITQKLSTNISETSDKLVLDNSIAKAPIAEKSNSGTPIAEAPIAKSSNSSNEKTKSWFGKRTIKPNAGTTNAGTTKKKSSWFGSRTSKPVTKTVNTTPTVTPNSGTVNTTGTEPVTPNAGTVNTTGTEPVTPNAETVKPTSIETVTPNGGTVTTTGTPNGGTVTTTGIETVTPNEGTVNTTGTVKTNAPP